MVKQALIVLDAEWDMVLDSDDNGRPLTRRELEDIDAFAAEMARWATFAVAVVGPDEVPSVLADTVLITEESTLSDIAERVPGGLAALARHVVLLNVHGLHREAVRLSELGVAATVHASRYFTWRTERDDDPGGGVFGRRDVGASMGAESVSGALWDTDSHVLLSDERYPSLPAMLAGYLQEYGCVADLSG